MTPHPIDTMPADIAEEELALLYCPEQGGWHTAAFFERRWVDGVMPNCAVAIETALSRER